MNYFEYKPVEVEEDGRRVLSVDIHPEKSCIFNCVICNHTKSVHLGEWHDFGPIEDSLEGLGEKITEEKPDLVHVYAKGDPLTNVRLEEIINYIHNLGLPVRLLTNCYYLGIGEHMRLASMCEEVVAGFCFTREEDFQKIRGPLKELGLTAAEQIESMVTFSYQYKGKFKLRVLLVKGYNDSDEKVAELKSAIDRVNYDTLWVGTWPKLTVSEERIAEIEKILRA